MISHTLDTVTLSKDEYQSIQEDLRWLSALEAAGVDNWEGIQYAYEIIRQQFEENIYE